MNTAVKTAEPINTSLLEQVVIGGDLAKLTPQERVGYYRDMCASLGLNPLTKPFAYLTLNGKLVLYAQRDCTDQLRRINGISVELVETKTIGGAFTVIARASDKTGRSDAATGAVWTDGLKGEALCNAMMKAETKAKRRATLSICGLGLLDEAEVDSIAGAQRMSDEEPIPRRSFYKGKELAPGNTAAEVPHDTATGEIFPPSDNIEAEQPALRTSPQSSQLDEGERAEQWGNEAIRRLDECDSPAKIEAWLKRNKDALGRCRAANEEAASAVVAAADYRMRKLAGTGVPA